MFDKEHFICLEVLAQLANAEIARPGVVTRVRTRDLTVVCEFNFSGLPFHLRPPKKKNILFTNNKLVQVVRNFRCSIPNSFVWKNLIRRGELTMCCSGENFVPISKHNDWGSNSDASTYMCDLIITLSFCLSKNTFYFK